MAKPTLPVARLIAVTVSLTASAAQAQNLNTLLVLGNSPVIDSTERMRTYADLSSVAADFGGNTPEYQAAVVYFGQKPKPRELKIGRWFQTAGAGKLIGKTLSDTEQTLTNFTSVTTGAFSVQLNGGAAQTISGINLSAALNLNGVAAAITTALGVNGSMVWNASFQRFEMVSATTGANSSVSFLSAPGSGTDISALLGMRAPTAGNTGAYTAPGNDAETALAAAQYFDLNFGQQWFGLTMPQITLNADHLAVAAFIEGTNTEHLYGVSTQDAGVLNTSVTGDIAYALSQAGYDKTLVNYSSNNAYSVASLMGRALTVNYNGNGTVITLMYKDEPGIVPEYINTTQANALQAKKCNAFVAYENDTAIIQNGVVSSGHFIDEITGSAWLKVTIQNNVFNLLYTSTTKIPQTDAGMNMIAAKITQVCIQGVNNGLLAPGIWNSSGFGILNEGDYLDKGYYVYAPPVSTQLPADRAARKSVPFQVAAKLAGAVHSVEIDVTVNP